MLFLFYDSGFFSSHRQSAKNLDSSFKVDLDLFLGLFWEVKSFLITELHFTTDLDIRGLSGERKLMSYIQMNILTVQKVERISK